MLALEKFGLTWTNNLNIIYFYFLYMDKIRLIELLDKFYAGLEIVKETDKILVNEVAKRPISKVLDIGMGFARIASKMIKKGLFVHGIETDNLRIEYVKKIKKNPGLSIEKKDAKHLDFNEEFDAAYCTSFCQIPNHEQILKGIFKAIKPGGWFFVTVDIPAKEEPKEDFNQKIEEFVSKLNPADAKEFRKALQEDTATFQFICKTPGEWKRLIESVGFKTEKFIGYYPRNALVVARKSES